MGGNIFHNIYGVQIFKIIGVIGQCHKEPLSGSKVPIRHLYNLLCITQDFADTEHLDTIYSVFWRTTCRVNFLGISHLSVDKRAKHPWRRHKTDKGRPKRTALKQVQRPRVTAQRDCDGAAWLKTWAQP
jgi:hypothetical protein